LPLPDGAYAGLTSAGTFTHGHVGPEALPELMRVLRPGAVCAVTGRPDFFEAAGFGAAFAALVEAGTITPPEIREERIYAGEAPEGHDGDLGLVIVFRRL
ncbi:MAG: methyltransferase, partial [Pseudomonadota bacterium]